MNTAPTLQYPVPAFPKIINVEVFRGDCPCRCKHCPVGVTPPSARHSRFGQAGMSLSLFRGIVDQIAQHETSCLRIHAVGEPLLWEGLREASALSRQAKVHTWIFTSAVTRDEHLLQVLCRNLDIIEVSVNSTTAEDYMATKGIDAFDLVRRNIERMQTCIRQEALPTKLIVSRVQSADKAADDTFVEYWQSSGLVADAFVRSYHTYNDLMPQSETSACKSGPCLVHWARFNIGVDGKAVVCFNELFQDETPPELVYGDVSQCTIADIWHGPAMEAVRRAECTGEYDALPSRHVLPCARCTSCQPLLGHGQTSEHQLKRLK